MFPSFKSQPVFRIVLASFVLMALWALSAAPGKAVYREPDSTDTASGELKSEPDTADSKTETKQAEEPGEKSKAGEEETTEHLR